MRMLIKGGRCFVDGRLIDTDVLIKEVKIQGLGKNLVAEDSDD